MKVGWRPPSTLRARRSSHVRGAAVALVALVVVLRTAYGFDLGDGAHHVELAQRVAAGDVPFRDEMNVQVLGALPLAPFVWVWQLAFGSTGVVLAARLWFVLVAALVGWVAHRLLRDHVAGGLAAVAVLLALVPQPYDLVSMSYNTAPGLLLLLACAAGTSTVLVPRTRRSLLCGAAAAAAALVNPLAVAGSLLTLLVVAALSRRWATVTWVAVGAAFTSVVGLVLLTGFGFGALGETLAFTSEYQELRTPPGERLRFALEFYGSLLVSPWVVAAGVCGVAALVPRLDVRVRRGLACLAVVLVGVVALRVANPDDGLPKSGMTSGVLAVVLVALVLVPAALVAVVRRDRVAGVLLLVGVLPFVVQAPVLAAATSSSPVWGAPAAAAAPAVLAVAVALGRGLGTFGPRWLALVVVLVATAHTLQPYRDAPFWEARLRTSGPLAGLLTGDSVARESASLEAAIRSCQRPGEGLLAYGAPAAYLFSDGPVDSNIIWLSTFAQANERTVSWIERTGREPDCVVVHSGSATRAPSGKWSTRQGDPDPLLDWVSRHFHLVEGDHGRYVVLRRDDADADLGSLTP